MPEEDDEDWFEAAFEDEEEATAESEAEAKDKDEEREDAEEAENTDEEEGEGAASEGGAAAQDTEERAEPGAADAEAPETKDGEPADAEAEPEEPDTEAEAGEPESGPAEDESENAVSGGFGEAPAPGDEMEPDRDVTGDAETPSEEDLFGGDFASDFESAPGPGGPDAAGGGGPGGGGGGGAGGAGEFGFDLGGGGAGGGGGGDEFGFDLGGAGGPPEAEEFSEEDFETEIPRIDLGIEGLDAMIQGGVPERSLIVAIGGAGTGKTTFGLQFLNKAIENGERAVYITLEESHDRVVRSADEKGWDFETHEANDQLAVIDLDPVEMANSLTSIRNELPRLIEDFGASRLVLDSVSLLEMMYDDQATRRTEIYDFTRALKQAGVTTMLTSEASEGNPFSSRHGIIEYLTDAVFVLRYVRPEDFRETRLAIEIQKIRDANHSRETKPYEITNEGISVYRQANIF